MCCIIAVMHISNSDIFMKTPTNTYLYATILPLKIIINLTGNFVNYFRISKGCLFCFSNFM